MEVLSAIFYNRCLSADVQQQLRILYGDLMKMPTVSVVHVQQQQGQTDCGLFAVTHAVHLHEGILVQCLTKKKLHVDLFPVEKVVTRVAQPDTRTLSFLRTFFMCINHTTLFTFTCI